MSDFKNENIWLMKGDCLERMKEISDNSVDMVLTDPPYGTTACKWDSVVDLELMWKELKRIIKPNGAIVLMANEPFTSIKWYKIWKPLKQRYDQERRSELEYGKDWGDGLFGTLRGLARKYGHCDGTIWYRVNKLNYSMKDALAAPDSDTDTYWLINDKHYLKSEVCKLVGLSRSCITQRMRKGIPFKYALVPERFGICQYKDKIFNLNGDMFWWGDLKVLYGEKKSIRGILNDYTTIENWLVQEDLLSDNDYFEEIDL